MSTVNVGELKNRLSYYLRRVRAGETVMIRLRDRVIARIEAVREESALPDDDETRLEDLEARGVIRRARRPLTRDWIGARPPVDANVVGAVLNEREDGR